MNFDDEYVRLPPKRVAYDSRDAFDEHDSYDQIVYAGQTKRHRTEAALQSFPGGITGSAPRAWGENSASYNDGVGGRALVGNAGPSAWSLAMNEYGQMSREDGETDLGNDVSNARISASYALQYTTSKLESKAAFTKLALLFQINVNKPEAVVGTYQFKTLPALMRYINSADVWDIELKSKLGALADKCPFVGIGKTLDSPGHEYGVDAAAVDQLEGAVAEVVHFGDQETYNWWEHIPQSTSNMFYMALKFSIGRLALEPSSAKRRVICEPIGSMDRFELTPAHQRSDDDEVDPVIMYIGHTISSRNGRGMCQTKENIMAHINPSHDSKVNLEQSLSFMVDLPTLHVCTKNLVTEGQHGGGIIPDWQINKSSLAKPEIKWANNGVVMGARGKRGAGSGGAAAAAAAAAASNLGGARNAGDHKSPIGPGLAAPNGGGPNRHTGARKPAGAPLSSSAAAAASGLSNGRAKAAAASAANRSLVEED